MLNILKRKLLLEYIAYISKLLIVDRRHDLDFLDWSRIWVAKVASHYTQEIARLILSHFELDIDRKVVVAVPQTEP